MATTVVIPTYRSPDIHVVYGQVIATGVTGLTSWESGWIAQSSVQVIATQW